MNAEDARRIAALMVEKLSGQIPVEFRMIDEPPPKSLKEIIQLGMIVTHNIREVAQSSVAGAFPIEPELLAALACANINPAPLTDVFAHALEASDENPAELEATLLNVVVPRGKLTNLMAATVEKFKVAAKQQGIEDRRIMFERWEALQPPLAALLELQRKHPKTEMADAVRFLAPEFPGMMRHVAVNWPTLEAFIAESSAYAKAKQIKTKAQYLAAAIVAKEFDMGYAYCLQLLAENRRAIKGRLRQRA